MEKKKTEETTAVVPYDKDKNILAIKDSISDLTAQEKAVIIKDSNSEKMAVELAGTVKSHVKALIEAKKFYETPVKTVLKKITDYFAALLDPLTILDRNLRGKVSAHQWTQEQARREQERKNAVKIEKAIEQGKTPPVIREIIETPKAVQTEAGRMAVKFEWHGTVINPDQVPIEYCEKPRPSQTKINDAVKNGIREIPGVEIKEMPTTNMR